MMEDTKWCRVHQNAAADSFYACKTGRFVTVLTMNELRKTPMNDTLYKLDRWFGKMFCFVKIYSLKVSRNHCPYNSETFIRRNYNAREDLCFVQRYEAIDEKLVEIGTIDKQLGFLTLR